MFGHWQVGDRRYLNKLQAVKHAVSIGHWIRWDFHEQQFGAYDWSHEPELTLDYYYSERAKIIRQSYQHVAVEFSGGADSWNLLYYFCKNQLPVDTVIHRYAADIVDGSYNLAPENQWAEGKFQAWPSFQYLQQLDPKLKWITRDIVNPMVTGWQSFRPNFEKQNNLHAGSLLKIHDAGIMNDMGIPANSSTAMVYGVDKPNVELINGKFYLTFYDFPLINRNVYDNILNDTVAVSDVLFYWSPDSIDMLAKQSHLIMKYFRNNPDKIYLLDKKKSKQARTEYLTTINEIIYPEFKPIWQTEKPAGLFDMTHESWFTKNLSIPGSKQWNETMKNFTQTLTDTLAGTGFEKFAHSDAGSEYLILSACPSKQYYLGDLDNTSA